jgi:hypothetical protein
MGTDYILWLLNNREKALAARAEEIERERQGIEKERAQIRAEVEQIAGAK